LVASSFVTRTIRSNGWLSGIITGLLYVGIVYLIGYLIFERFSINTLNALPFIIAIIIGALGGVIGINMKRK
jgi:putative membrane protein (TIGR04086 family)